MRAVKNYLLASGSSAGASAEEISVSNQFTTYIITITGLATGNLTVRAMAEGGDAFETVDDGTLDLSLNAFLRWRVSCGMRLNCQLKTATAYNYRIEGL